MGLNAAGMERLRNKQQILGEEPIYCAAYDDNEEILYLGTDTALSQPERTAKRLRYEDQALRYLRGQRPRLLSAALRGPFDRASGWRNPWLPKQQVVETHRHTASNTQEQPPTEHIRVLLNERQEGTNLAGTGRNRTPAIRDSLQCHLPSPDSHRELELNDDSQLDTTARSRIQEWARDVSADSLERDDFWAPDVGVDHIPETKVIPKRPAGREWLKSKFHKRLKIDNTSFETAQTPTSARPLHEATAGLSSFETANLSQPEIVGNQNFEEATPASSSGQSVQNSTQGPTVKSVPRGDSSSGHVRDVAAEVEAYHNHSDKDLRLASRRSGRKTSRTKSRALSSETSRIVDPAAIGLVFAQNVNTQARDEQQVPSEHDNSSFESNLDQSFHYKARNARQLPAKLEKEGVVLQHSQPTQTGTPESEEHGDFVHVQHEMRDDSRESHGTLVHDVHGNSDIASTDCADVVRNTSTTFQDELKPTEANSTHEAHDANGSRSDLAENHVYEETTLLDEDISPKTGQHDLDQSQSPSSGPPEGQLKPNGAEPVHKSIVSRLQNFPSQCSSEIAPDDGPTLIADITNVNTSTPAPEVRVPEILKVTKYALQPLEGLEVARMSCQPAASNEDEESNPTFQSNVREASNCESDEPESANQVQKNAEFDFLTAHAELALVASHSSHAGSYIPQKVHDMSHENVQPIEMLERDEHHVLDTENLAGTVLPSQMNSSTGTDIQLFEVPSVDIAGTPQPESPLTKVEATFVQLEEDDVSVQTAALQSPCIPNESDIKIEPVEEEVQRPYSRPISVTSSLVNPPLQPRVSILQQDPWIQPTESSNEVVGLQTSVLLQQPLPSGSPQPLSRLSEDQQSPWNDPTNHIIYSDQRLVGFSSQSMLPPTSSGKDLRSSNAASHIGSGSGSVGTGPASSDPNETRYSGLFGQLATPSQTNYRQLTPEAQLSIKSFATFNNSPSPKCRRRSKQPRLSGDRLPSTQVLVDATNANPWNSIRSSLRSSERPRSHLRVSFASLPDQGDGIHTPSQSVRSTTKRATSPPPQSALDTGDENIDGQYQRHFDMMREKSTSETGAPNVRFATPLLPSESQQKPMTPEIGMMAQAFRDADANIIRSTPRPGPEPRSRLASDSTPEIAVDEPQLRDGDALNTGIQTPWRAESQNQGLDDVADVLQNLDDFLNPRWDVDDTDKTKPADGLENYRRERSPVLFADSIWDSL